MELEVGERMCLDRVENKMRNLFGLLTERIPDLTSSEIGVAYRWLVEIKMVLGNLNNDVSFVGALLAKDFLLKRHRLLGLDISSKAQGAPGLDIDETTSEGDRVVAEIKTTIPYAGNKLGAQQEVTFRKDFVKLGAAKARFKYFFVTEKDAFDATLRKYQQDLEGITLVLLPEGAHDDRFVRAL